MVQTGTNLFRIIQCVFIFVISGGLSASFLPVPRSVTPESSTTTPTVQTTYQLSFEITNRVFNDSLLNPSSQDYKKMYNEVNQLLADTLGCPSCTFAGIYGGVDRMDFRSGSVKAKTVIVFNTAATNINQFVVKFEFLDSIKNHPDSVLQINQSNIDGGLSASFLPVPRSVTPESSTTTPTVQTTYQLSFEITNRVFNDSLLNPSSQDYKKMYNEVNQLLADTLGCPSCTFAGIYGGVDRMDFRSGSVKSGSVKANTVIVFNTAATNINQFVVKFEFLDSIKNHPDSVLQINQSNIDGGLSASFLPVPRSVTPESSTTTPTVQTTYQLSFEITNRVFNDSLLNPNSQDYKKMYNEVNQLLADTLGCPSCTFAGIYGGVDRMDFRSGSVKSGSVKANTVIVFNTAATNINQFLVKFEFLDSIKNHPDSVLQINQSNIDGGLSASFLPVPRSVTPESSTTTPTVQTTYQLSFEITNRVFNDSLLNPSSQDYKKMYNEVNQLLADTLGCPSCTFAGIYGGVDRMDFRSGSVKSGSVKANTVIVFNTAATNINQFLVKFEFLDSIKNHPDSVLQINQSNIDVNSPPVTTTTINTSATTMATSNTPLTTKLQKVHQQPLNRPNC